MSPRRWGWKTPPREGQPAELLARLAAESGNGSGGVSAPATRMLPALKRAVPGAQTLLQPGPSGSCHPSQAADPRPLHLGLRRHTVPGIAPGRGISTHFPLGGRLPAVQAAPQVPSDDPVQLHLPDPSLPLPLLPPVAVTSREAARLRPKPAPLSWPTDRSGRSTVVEELNEVQHTQSPECRRREGKVNDNDVLNGSVPSKELTSMGQIPKPTPHGNQIRGYNQGFS
ncbi:uncharacterized protein LOC118145697 isoform X5 [Callithrix jacchus]|uniref:uncharacterized protein LOC118145697 isoform X2 n=1 Tax=Callithrix jacchus TaxID=9483 RepID=UPI0004F05C09|nr:uncharacterized protein LOC118145697 isoform X2 [Callithrix jacchus]